MTAGKGLLVFLAIAISLSFSVIQAEAKDCLAILEKGMAKSKKIHIEYKELKKEFRNLLKKKGTKEEKEKNRKARKKVGDAYVKHCNKIDSKIKSCIKKKLEKAEKGKFNKGWDAKKFSKAFKTAVADEEKEEKAFAKCNKSKKDKKDCERILLFQLEAEKRKYKVLDAAVK